MAFGDEYKSSYSQVKENNFFFFLGPLTYLKEFLKVPQTQ